MFKLLAFLAAGLFVTLQIGGRDRGQVRLGLADAGTRGKVVMPAPVPPAPEPRRVALTRPASVPQTHPAEPVMPVREPDRVAAVPDAGVERTVVAAPPSSPAPSDVSLRPLLYIGASSLNVRQGPSTDTSVVERLTRGEAVSVVEDLGDGWVQIRIEGDGVDGYVASRFLTADPFAN